MNVFYDNNFCESETKRFAGFMFCEIPFHVGFGSGRLKSYIKHISFHSLLRGVIRHIWLSLQLWFHRSFVFWDEIWFRNRDDGNWQSHRSNVRNITSLTCTLWYHSRQEKVFGLEEHTHTHTHTHKQTHKNTHTHTMLEPPHYKGGGVIFLNLPKK